MKTRRVTTILTSAYLSTMLFSSVAPIGRSILATPFDPATAQAAFDKAIGRLDTAGWVSAAPVVVPVTLKAAPANDPVISEELMGRIIKYGRDIPKNGVLSGDICKIFGRCDGTAVLVIKSVGSDIDGHFFSIPADPNNKDIYITVYLTPTTSRSYLTDKTGTLRAAAAFENNVWHLITNEQGAAGFKAEMTQYAKEAAVLPPAGTSVAAAGNS